jgi:hypothetical protein
MKDNAMTLFEHAGMVTGNKGAEVLFTTEVTSYILPKDSKTAVPTQDPEEVERLLQAGGTLVGRKTVLKQGKQSEVRTALSMKGKDNQAQWEMTKRDAEIFAAGVIMRRLATLDMSRIGLKRYAERIGADGLTTFDIKLKEHTIKEAAITLEQAIVAWPHMTREQIVKMFAMAGIRPKGMTVDVNITPVEPKGITEGVADLQKEALATEKAAQAAAQAQAKADAAKGKK